MAKKLKLVTKAEPAAKAAPTKATAKPVAKAAKAATKEEKKSRFIGITSGLGVTAYQNESLEKNRKAKKTDEQLAADWRREFPNAIARYTAETVSGVRGLYNKGKHGNDAPDEPLRAYDESGDPLPLWGEKTREKEAARQERVEAAAAAAKATKKTVVKKAKKSA